MKKVITNKQEIELSELINFNGKYVDSLVKSAQRYVQGDNVKELLSNYKTLKKDQIKAESKRFFMNPTEYNRLSVKASYLLSDFHTGHSMGCYREMYITQKSKDIKFTSNNILHTYAGRKWSPTYGQISLYLSKKDLKKIEKIEGIWTIVYPDGSAKWLTESGRKHSHSIEWTKGYCVGTTHSEISLEEAQEGEAKKLHIVLDAIKDDTRFIGHQHIRNTGACDAGIRVFCRKYNLDIDMGYNLGYLKSLEYSNFFDKVSNL